MYPVLLNLHSYLSYLVLAALFFAALSALFGFSGHRPFTERDRKVALVGLIAAHTQLLIGLILYFVSPRGIANLSAATMKDSASRLAALEHPLINIIGIILITVGYSRAKRLKNDRARFRSVFLLYGLGLVLILSRIPWRNWIG
jgi:uncharacterized membrane protein